MDISAIQKILERQCGLDRERKIVAGVSGGPDSLCLLDLLHRLGYPVVVAHFDHHLRDESVLDAERVRSAAQKIDAPFLLGEGDVRALAQAAGQSIEEAAREARYRFLFDMARELNAQAVAVGHTADDQVETVLMHFVRGAGLAGLRGMRPCSLTEWDEHIPLVRPLLGVWREEILAYCEERALLPVFDQSNLDTTLYRNRLRHELIPYLQQYNPQIKEVILRTAQAADGDYQVLESLSRQAWQQALVEQGDSFVALSMNELRDLPSGLKRSLLRIAIEVLRPGLRNIDFETVQRAVDLIDTPERSRHTSLSAGLSLSTGGGLAVLYEDESPVQLSGWPQMPPGTVHMLDVPGRLELSGGWVIESEWVSMQEQPGMEHPSEAWLNPECLQMPLEVRTRRPGDRFQPLGMDGHSLKLSDYFINRQLPRLARDGWPLVCSRGEIVWVCGYRPAHACRVEPETDRAVHLTVKRGS